MSGKSNHSRVTECPPCSLTHPYFPLLFRSGWGMTQREDTHSLPPAPSQHQLTHILNVSQTREQPQAHHTQQRHIQLKIILRILGLPLLPCPVHIGLLSPCPTITPSFPGTSASKVIHPICLAYHAAPTPLHVLRSLHLSYSASPWSSGLPAQSTT